MITYRNLSERFPSVSSGDSLDWKEPTPEEIKKKVLDGVKSGSILLFHNDLANTTAALPDILAQLKQDGYGFVKVSDLIYQADYTIDPNGMQIAQVKAGIDISAENVEAVMAQYSDEIKAAGFTDEQIAQAAQAITNGAEIPEEVLEVIADMGIEIPVSVDVASDDTGNTNVVDTQAGSDVHAAVVKGKP